MKAVQFASFGTPHEVTECVEAPDPPPPSDEEVVVDVEAFPINPVDLLTISGRYAVKPSLPATPGSEGVGRIAAVGGGVKDLRPGERVLLLGRNTWAQRRTVKQQEVLPLPEQADVLQLAMLKINPATALLMLRNYVDLKPGDWLIQDAANSGVGTNVIRLARANGIKTVNVVRRQSLIGSVTSIGADVVVVDGEDLAERVREETEAAPIRLAIDAVAGEICTRLADCLVDGGTIVTYGLLSGRPCTVTPHQVVFRGITLTGFWLAKVLSEMPYDEISMLYATLGGRLADGTIAVPVEATYPIERIKSALAHAAREGRGGKILVTPNGPV